MKAFLFSKCMYNFTVCSRILFIRAATDAMKSVVNDRLGGKKSSSSRSSSSSGGSGNGAVVTLNDGNFEDTVLGSSDIWLVEFFAPWCGELNEKRLCDMNYIFFYTLLLLTVLTEAMHERFIIYFFFAAPIQLLFENGE